jgi:hypothetical protein
MRPVRWFVGLVAIGVLALAVMVPTTVAVTHVDLKATLHGGLAFPNATGSSVYDRGGGVREVTVTVSNVPELNGHTVVFYVAGHKIGGRVVHEGTATIQHETIHGQYVPFASAGDSVRVRTRSTEQIVKGVYVRTN